MLRSADAPPLDPSSGEGRRLLADELAGPEYSPQESLLRRAVDVVVRWFRDLFDGASGGPISFWWYAVVAGAVLVLLALVAWALLRLEPARRRRRVGPGAVFDEPGLSAEDYRRRARAASAAGDHAAAILDGYRALVAGAVERFVLDDRPGATAREIAVSLGEVFPPESDHLGHAARVFDAVRYGGERPGAADGQAVLALEDRIRAAAPLERAPT